ncbi:MAG TPA: hypothetical protein DIU15_02560, partial [Deltaproteobacteria bacterium]|nr:hypothetical protein [Deltaproteobacteria bacterium]
WGGAELQAWVRWAPKKRFETSHRFWTHTFSSIGWEPEFRIQAVRGPFDLTIEFAPMFSLCCGVGTEQKFLSAGLGFDVGIAVGKRFGGPQSAAIYFAPHYQMTWTFPPDAGWDGHRLLNLPVGLDIPMGKSPFAIRPEIMVVSVIRPSGFAPLWRVGGGVAIALQGMGPKKLKAFNEAKAAGKPLPDDWDKKKKKGKKGKKVPEAKEEEPAPAP